MAEFGKDSKAVQGVTQNFLRDATSAIDLDAIKVATEATQAAVEIMDDWDETNRAKVNPIVGQAGVAAGTGPDSVKTQRVSLATNIPLPIGTNALGTVGVTSNVDPALEIARGNVSGQSSVNKYGRATDGVQTTATDIWDRADAAATQQIWLAPTAARIHEIVSSSDADSDSGGTVAQGQGCRTIRIFGLKTWDLAETSEDIIMDGTATGANSVDTANSYVIIHRMKMLTHGTSGPNVGVIRAVAKDDVTTTAQIGVGNGQTEMSIYGVPSTQKAYMTSFDVNSHNTGNPSTVIETDFDLLINEHPDVDETAAAFLVKANVGLIATGSTVFSKTYVPPLRIDGPAIIKFQAIATLADTESVAEYDLILVDN